jgi:hypothetical protein
MSQASPSSVAVVSVSSGSCPWNRQELQLVQADARKRLLGEPFGVVPGLRPVGADHDDRAFGDPSVLVLPCLDVFDGGVITGIGHHLVVNVDDDEGTDGVCRGEVGAGGSSCVPYWSVGRS